MRDISLVKLLPIEPRVPFISLRMVAAVISVLGLIASVFLFSTRGLNYGIDFTGGTVLEIDTGGVPPLDDIREHLNDLGLGNVQLQTIAPPEGSPTKHDYVRISLPLQEETPEVELGLIQKMMEKIDLVDGDNFNIDNINDQAETITYQVTYGDKPILEALRNDEELAEIKPDVEEIQSLLSGLAVNNLTVVGTGDNSFDAIIDKKDEASANVQQLALGLVQVDLLEDNAGFTVRGQDVVGSKVSGELRQKGVIAIILALGMVLFYIWFRFEWQFAVGAVAALFHDVLLTIGVFSLTQLEFNLSIIAAILTIVGYSLNDTVIVYDRIRENLRKYKKMALPALLNLSINDTLSRTIMTSMTTLLALTALYILGGSGLRGFSFAMIWGVFVGTYSSIFVASPLLLLLRLRRGQGNIEASDA